MQKNKNKNYQRDKLNPIPASLFLGLRKGGSITDVSVTPKENSQSTGGSFQAHGAQELSVHCTKSDILKRII